VAFRQQIGMVATGARASAGVFETTCRRVHVFLADLMTQRVTRSITTLGVRSA
jgi:hypothetical protein